MSVKLDKDGNLVATIDISAEELEMFSYPDLLNLCEHRAETVGWNLRGFVSIDLDEKLKRGYTAPRGVVSGRYG